MKDHVFTSALFCLVLFLGLADKSYSQENLTLTTQESVDNKKPDGWHPKLKIKMNLSMGSSKSVVGQIDGESTTVGGTLEAGLDYKKKLNEWRQQLDYIGATTQNPSLPRYVKSADEMKYSTIYLRSLKSYPNIGPYAKLEARTNIFKGEDVRAEPKEYLIRSTTTSLGTHHVFRLTDGFIPLTTQESVGFFAKIIDKKTTTLEFRLGFGAIQVRTNNQFRIDDIASTPDIIEVSPLNDINQSGLEYGFIFKGKWNENSDYSLTADFLTPFGTDIEIGKDCYSCNSWELTNIDLKAALASKINSWMQISYQYRALKQPEVFNVFQVQHGFALNFMYDVFK